MPKNKGLNILGVILILAFGYGLIHLLLLRFESGDVYPYYSSLRSDPLGVKVLYESLQDCCGVSVERSYEPFPKIKNRSDSVYLDIGDRASGVSLVPKGALDDLEFYIRNGGRLVITFLPYRSQGELKKDLAGSFLAQMEPDTSNPPADLRKVWGFDYFSYDLPGESGESTATASAKTDAALPAEITIHTVLYFSDLSSQWKILYERGGHAVLVERALGKGTLVLSAESYFLSNEAMLNERHPDLIAWLVQGKKEVIFDEYDHGVAYNPGVATLMRKYGLQWLLAGVLLLAALFVWKSAAGLVPAFRDEEEHTRFALFRGNDAAAGMTHLLRRSIPAGNILNVCYQEWKKSQKTKHVRKLDQIESVLKEQQQLPPRRRDPAGSYNRVSGILAERK